MSLYQTSVLKQHIQLLDKEALEKAYKKYTKYFLNTTIQENIRASKEEEYQGIFLTELFVNVLGYTLKPNANYNLVAEYKNQNNARKADGAILRNENAIGVIELKGTNTKDLESIRKQAFDYKANQKGCIYVITSNFEKLRFYINDATEFEEFNLFELTQERFALLYLCLQKDNVLNNIPLTIKEASVVEEEQITKQFYKDYSLFKRELYRDLVKRNAKQLKNEAQLRATETQTQETTEEEQKELLRLEKNVKLTLFKKSQKLIDRYLFIFFAEDRGLLPANSTVQILDKWKDDVDFGDERPLYDLFKQYFNFLDQGRAGTKSRAEIYAYNGGLFKPDTILDALEIDNELLYKHTYKLASYDFESQVDVNILGHIFENSLNEIESVNAEIEGGDFDKQKSKRKKDGVFYTPKYITKYIVENTVGKLCEEKKTELGFKEEEYFKGRKNRQKATIEKLVTILDIYRDWLLQLTICDPACGSGAFLNQALNFLIAEHQYIDELKTKVLGGGLQFPDIENTILENNIYGVDLNEESVEIAKLSLWLRTAQPRRKLNDLSNNIKCGNSLIDSKAVAGDKAFNWETEFPQVFAKGGFDVIIGNPPYGAYLDKNSKKYYASKFNTFQGNHEIYFFFIELLDSILKEKGKVGYITPDTWINIPQAQKLRKHVLDIYGIENIVTFSYSVFADASVNALVFILTKNNFIKECLIIHTENKILELNVSNFDIKKVKIASWKNSIDNQFQVWQNETDISIIKKVSNQSNIGSDYLDVCQGIVPYSTEHLSKEQIKERIYHSNKKEDGNYGKWVQGRSIKRYCIDDSVEEYLNYGDWLHRSRKSKYFNGDRILIQEITGGNPPRISAAIYKDVLYHDPGIISCLNISNMSSECLLAVINSTLMSWYNLKTSPKGKRTTFPKVLIGDIRRFPLKEVESSIQELFYELVNEISDFTSSKNKLSNKFKKYITSQFQLEKLSKKLQNWHELEFGDFIKEVNKTIKKENKERIKKEETPIATLTKLDEMDWMDVFETKKAEAQVLQQQIDQTDKEIDAMVYELYGLTEEEIAIVENS
ncbi:Eco57I restriction-modification methylase domain-containing protein [Tenacibaculum crassostreae]|uniref:Eco57I restriction-modification methylase domain-containing protein n=1 Tax=Tenacibaculum crassostreae TaxID=502683 RepID=UPI003894CC9A